MKEQERSKKFCFFLFKYKIAILPLPTCSLAAFMQYTLPCVVFDYILIAAQSVRIPLIQVIEL